MAEEYTRLSSLVNTRIRLPTLVLEDEISESYDLRILGGGNLDFSVLVELRHFHQTRHAAEGVRTRDSTKPDRPSESMRCKLIREMNGLLRQSQTRATGTGQDRQLRWQASAQGTPDSGLAPVPARHSPALTGNSANTATVATLKYKKVCFRIWPPANFA